LVNTLHETLTFNVLDYNEHRADTDLGAATFELTKLLDDSTHEGVNSTILKDGKDRGELRYDISYYPVLKAAKVDGKEELPETSMPSYKSSCCKMLNADFCILDVGIVRLTMHQCKELDATKSMSGELNPLCKLYVGGSSKPIHKTKPVKHTNSPVWEVSQEFICADKTSSVVTIEIVDERDFLKDPVVGYMSLRLVDLLEAKKVAGRDWWPLSGCKSGRMRLSVEWKPLDMPGSLEGANQYRQPIGVVRLWIQKATDVKCVYPNVSSLHIALTAYLQKRRGCAGRQGTVTRPASPSTWILI
jgi:Ca2+-dependent lipid-binding protein